MVLQEHTKTFGALEPNSKLSSLCLAGKLAEALPGKSWTSWKRSHKLFGPEMRMNKPTYALFPLVTPKIKSSSSPVPPSSSASQDDKSASVTPSLSDTKNMEERAFDFTLPEPPLGPFMDFSQDSAASQGTGKRIPYFLCTFRTTHKEAVRCARFNQSGNTCISPSFSLSFRPFKTHPRSPDNLLHL